jgi:hemoglobin-like flavoprotein
MLQGRPPVRVSHLIDLEEKTRFFGDPEAFGGAWLRRSPSLTRIVLRMLHPDADKRWESLAAVVDALGGQATVAENNRWLAKQSYLRLMERRDEFLAAFYQNLFGNREDLEATFPDRSNRRRWKKQYAMLGAAIRDLLNFSAVHGAAEPTILSETAASHRARGLTSDDYVAFEEAFLHTLPEFDEGSEEMSGAWRACFASGMAYMKRWGTPEDSSSP